MALCRVAAVTDLRNGDFAPCEAAGKRLLLIKLDGSFYAHEDRCAHLGVLLSEGSLEDGVLTCRAHCYQYDARTGCGLNPRSLRLRTFRVEVEDGHLLVDVGEETK